MIVGLVFTFTGRIDLKIIKGLSQKYLNEVCY